MRSLLANPKMSGDEEEAESASGMGVSPAAAVSSSTPSIAGEF
jgi:hypothetical protein